MPMVNAGDVNLHYEEHGAGDTPVVFIHGNLGCNDWMDLVWPLLPGTLRVIAIEWRGCGRSEKPAPDPEYANYSMRQHARDMLAATRSLGLAHCHLCGHSTGGIIATHMICMEPERFGKVLLLDPVGPMGLDFGPEHHAFFAEMKANPDVASRALATAMPSLFEASSLGSGHLPEFAATATEAQRRLFGRLVQMTRVLSDGIWFGTLHNLSEEWRSAALRAGQEQIRHELLVLWGALDQWIPRAHMEEMAARIPNCRLEVADGVGHSMNVEDPRMFAGRFVEFFLGGAAPPAVHMRP